MRNLADTLVELDVLAAKVLGEASVTRFIQGDDDDDALMDAAAIAARLIRRCEAVLVEIAGEAEDRVSTRPHDERITTRLGARSTEELLERATLSSPHTVSSYVRVAREVHRDLAISSGELLPPELPALRQALTEGSIGVDSFVSALGPLHDVLHAVGREKYLQAEAEIARAARGSDAAPPLGARDLRIFAQVLAAYLDPDGAEPRDALALRRRGITFGRARDGVVPVRGNLLPDVAAQWQRIYDSLLNPKVGGVADPSASDAGPGASVASPGASIAAPSASATGPGASRNGQPRFVDIQEAEQAESERCADQRSRAQKQHDALATILTVAARSGELPTIGGAAPTLIVSVRAEDFIAGTGVATVEGSDEPVCIEVARHAACSGGVERVEFSAGGRVLSLGVIDRVFNQYQRKAIIIRDGGCLIPGCHVPAGWCEIHHVTEHSRGGPTHTDNGVLLCWWHHRNLDRGGWQIRMNHGVPEVRGPSHWDQERKWRATTKSWIRQLDLRRAPG